MLKTQDLQEPSKEVLDQIADRILAKMSQKAGNPQPADGPSSSPVRRAKKNKKAATAPRIQYLNADELTALFAAVSAAGNARDLAIFEVAYHRGLRASEVGLLELRNVRLEARRMFVTRLKGGNAGEHLLTEREVRALRAWLRKRGTAPGALFASRKGSAISRKRLDVLMKMYGAAAELPPEKRHFHCLRHSCATSLLEHDVDIREVQDHLGHRDIRNTQHYAQVTGRKRQKTGERLYKEW